MKKNPLIIFALDSADPKLLKKYMEAGYLPNLKRLADAGCQAVIKDKNTIIEAGIYNIIFSGESRGEAGHYDFRQIIPGTYKLKHHVDGTDFGRDPFWGELKNTDKKVFVMDVFDASIVPDLDGIQVANWGVNNMKRPMTASPSTIIPEIESFAEPIFANQKMPVTFKESKVIYETMLRRLDKKVSIVSHLLKKDNFDFMIIGFGEVHGATHQFWRYRPEQAANDPDWQPTELTDAIRNIYQKTDESIGRILNQLPSEADTFVITNCGFRDQYPFENLLANFCVSLDYQTLKQKPLSEKLRPLNLVRSFFPLSWRIAFSRKFLNTEQRDGILSDKFENDTEWGKTTLFDLSSVFTTFLRVNLKGREPQGTIAAGDEYDNLLKQVEKDLRALKDKKSGKPLVKDIIKTKGTFTETEPIDLPDIIASFHDFPYFIEEAIHPKGNIKQEKNLFYRDSNHDDEGFFIAAGVNIESGKLLPNVSPMDFAPTFLTLLEQPIPDYMHGNPLAIINRSDTN